MKKNQVTGTHKAHVTSESLAGSKRSSASRKINQIARAKEEGIVSVKEPGLGTGSQNRSGAWRAPLIDFRPNGVRLKSPISLGPANPELTEDRVHNSRSP